MKNKDKDLFANPLDTPRGPSKVGLVRASLTRSAISVAQSVVQATTRAITVHSEMVDRVPLDNTKRARCPSCGTFNCMTLEEINNLGGTPGEHFWKACKVRKQVKMIKASIQSARTPPR